MVFSLQKKNGTLHGLKVIRKKGDNMMKTLKTHNHSQMKRKPYGNLSNSSVEQFCEKNVVSLEPDATVLEAAKLMAENHIGDIVVIDGEVGKSVPIGIVTDRDIVIKAIARNASPETMKLSELMTPDIVTANVGDDLS